jgi:spore germination protein YaaH
MRNLLLGKRCMIWSFMGNSRMFQALNTYGDRLDTVGLFTFEVDITGTLTETGTNINGILPYVQKWPHIKWLLTVMNHGTAAIFTALRNNTNGAKTKFLSELVRIMQKYPWCAGVDIDLERGGEYENKDAANALFRDIYQTVKAYNPAKLVNICLPGMTGINGSVGGENWCSYADLNPYCDTAAIMSYGMAWAGSAPGPVSPRSWLEGIYDYATRVMTPSKVFLGLGGYGWNWRIHDTPANMGMVNRGVSNTYYAARDWLDGKYNFTGDAPPQPFIPFIGYWDDYVRP